MQPVECNVSSKRMQKCSRERASAGPVHTHRPFVYPAHTHARLLAPPACACTLTHADTLRVHVLVLTHAQTCRNSERAAPFFYWLLIPTSGIWQVQTIARFQDSRCFKQNDFQQRCLKRAEVCGKTVARCPLPQHFWELAE